MTALAPKTVLTGCLAPIDKGGLEQLIANGKANPNVIKTLKCKTVAEGKFRHANYIRNLPPYIVDEPPALLGDDTAPNPSEASLAALGSCIAVGAATRPAPHTNRRPGVRLHPGPTARAGTPLAEVERTLAERGQMLPFEPMDHRALLGMTSMLLFFVWRSDRKFVWAITIVLFAVLLLPLMPDTWWERMGTMRTYGQDESAL
eukprot:gene9328-12593_t